MAYCYGYIRVSSDRQARLGMSLESQKDMILRYFDYRLKPNGVVWGGFYQDAFSASKTNFVDRPSGKVLNARVTVGDHIVFAKIDRAFRNLADFSNQLQEWSNRGIFSHSTAENLDFSTSHGRLAAQMVGAVAEFESSRLSERLHESIHQRKLKGGIMGTYAPIGFLKKSKSEYKFFQPERDVMAKLLEWEKAGFNYDQMAIHLIRNKIRTPKPGVSDRRGNRTNKPLTPDGEWWPAKCKQGVIMEKHIRALQARGVTKFEPKHVCGMFKHGYDKLPPGVYGIEVQYGKPIPPEYANLIDHPNPNAHPPAEPGTH